MPVITAGSWVQIEREVLSPQERAPQIPDETKNTPLVLRAKGFLKRDARLGESVEIESIIGRALQGTLIAVNPPYVHGFGAPIPELLHVGREFRDLVSPGEEAKPR